MIIPPWMVRMRALAMPIIIGMLLLGAVLPVVQLVRHLGGLAVHSDRR